jgi:hypothetical protein
MKTEELLQKLIENGFKEYKNDFAYRYFKQIDEGSFAIYFSFCVEDGKIQHHLSALFNANERTTKDDHLDKDNPTPDEIWEWIVNFKP